MSAVACGGGEARQAAVESFCRNLRSVNLEGGVEELGRAYTEQADRFDADARLFEEAGDEQTAALVRQLAAATRRFGEAVGKRPPAPQEVAAALREQQLAMNRIPPDLCAGVTPSR